MLNLITERKFFVQKKGCLVSISIALSIGLFFGCTPMLREKPPSLTGTFSGTLRDGTPIRMTLLQDQNTVTGHGVVGARSFSLSGLTSWQGPMVLGFEDGATEAAHVTLSPDGAGATVKGLGQTFALEQGGSPVRATPGLFAGRYSKSGPSPLWLVLTQSGNLLAGTGYIDGKPVAVVGRVTELRQASGSLLFSDESQCRAKVTLSDDSRALAIHGLGLPIQMTRE